MGDSEVHGLHSLRMSHEHMTEDERYAYWRDRAQQNAKLMARMLDIPHTTVSSWVSRGRWRARAAAEDLRDFGDTVSYLRRAEARRGIMASKVLDRAIQSVYGEDGRPMEGDPTPMAVKEAGNTLARLGISPKTVIQHEFRDSSDASEEALLRILESEDEEALMAILLKQPIPEKYAAIEAEIIDPNPSRSDPVPDPA